MMKTAFFCSLLAIFTFGGVCGVPVKVPIERNLNENHPYHPKQEYHPYHPKLEKKETRSQAPAQSNSTVAAGPTSSPTESPAPSPSPSSAPTQIPTTKPSSAPTKTPTVPSDPPTESPAPSPSPSDTPTSLPSASPSSLPSASPSSSVGPSSSPSALPTSFPSQSPSQSQAPSGTLQLYRATDVEIMFPNVGSSFNMNGDDVDLFEQTTQQYLDDNFLPSDVEEIQIEAVTVTKQFISGGRRRLSTARMPQVYNLSLTFNVMALVKHNWSDPFDLKEDVDTYFADDTHINELRTFLEAKGGDFIKSPGAQTNGEGQPIETDPSPDVVSVPIGPIIGAVVGSLFMIGLIAKLSCRRKFSSQRSKISLASTDSQDDDDDESSQAEMISSNSSLSKQQIMLLFSPREENESKLSAATRPAFLTTENNIEVPETPIGFTPKSIRTGVFAMDTPNSIFSAKNSTKSTFRKFLMDTPPSAMNGPKKSSRGFFPPPRTTGGSQRNLRQGKDTIDVSNVSKDLSTLDQEAAFGSPIQIFTEQDFMKAQAAAKVNHGSVMKKKGSTMEKKRGMGKFRLRKWPSEYVSDESSSEA